MDNQLANQAVIIRRDFIALVNARIDANAQPTRRMPIGDLAGRRGEAAGIFSIDPAFNGVAGNIDIALRDG